jgi:hypothetical protein
VKNRRSFLQKLGAIVAVVALAPEICFKYHFPAPKTAEPLNLQELFNQFYAIKRARKNAGNSDSIEIQISDSNPFWVITEARREC